MLAEEYILIDIALIGFIMVRLFLRNINRTLIYIIILLSLVTGLDVTTEYQHSRKAMTVVRYVNCTHHLTMRLISIFVIGLTFIISCNNQTVHESTAQNDNVKTVRSDDQLINSAIENAKQTFTQFDTAFKNGSF